MFWLNNWDAVGPSGSPGNWGFIFVTKGSGLSGVPPCFRPSLSWLRKRTWTAWWGLGDTRMAGAWKATQRHPAWARSRPSMRWDIRCTCCWRRPSAWRQGASPHQEGITTHLRISTTTYLPPSRTQTWWPVPRAPWADGEGCSGYPPMGQMCISVACPDQ